MTKRTITAEFANGDVATRVTGAPYTHASRRQVGTQSGRGRTVRFHTSEDAAREVAGRSGEVVRTDFVAPDATSVDGDTWTVTYADGETRDVQVSAHVSPIAAGQVARPGVAITGAKRVSS